MVLPITVFGVTAFIFGLTMLLSPVERASLYVRDIPKSPEALQRIVDKYGFNDPIHVQYWRWVKKVFRGDLGWSKVAQRPVTEAIAYYFPASAELALFAMVPVIVVGVLLGVLSAVYQDTIVDHSLRTFAIVGWSLPTFIFGLLMLMAFYNQHFQLLPPGRLSDWAFQVVTSSEFNRYTGMNTLDAILNGRLDIFLDALRHLILPVLTLSYVQWALLLRVTRSSMLEVLRREYILTARSKGLKESAVIFKHALRNALIPVATMGGLMLVGLLNGVVITETIFNYRGLGWWAARAAVHLDIPSVLGYAMLNTFLMVLGNLLVDITYALIDPRIRLE